MTRLPEPKITACAIATVIATRARAIANLADHIAVISDPLAVKSEAWEVYSKSLGELLRELETEIEFFDSKV